MSGIANISQPRGVVTAGGCQGVPVGAEGHRVDDVGMAGEGAQQAGLAGFSTFHNRTVVSWLAVVEHGYTWTRVPGTDTEVRVWQTGL
jgi:hypothetical protein